MTLLFCDSFDHYTTVTEKYDVAAGASIVAGRFGNGLKCGGESASTQKAVASSSELTVGFAYYATQLSAQFSGENALVSFYLGGTAQIQIYPVVTSGYLYVTRLNHTSAYVLPLNAWTYFEVKVVFSTSATGSVVVKANGVTIINQTGVVTAAGSAAADRVYLHGTRNSVGTYDDLYILDALGSTNNTFLGDVRVEALFPNGNGNSSVLVGSDGNSTDNYLLVDETAPSTADYVESSTVGDKDTYAMTNVTPTTGSVLAVQVLPYAAKTDAGTRSIVSVARLSATEVDSVDKALGVTAVYLPDVRETKPGGGAWTITDVNSAEFGVKVTA